MVFWRRMKANGIVLEVTKIGDAGIAGHWCRLRDVASQGYPDSLKDTRVQLQRIRTLLCFLTRVVAQRLCSEVSSSC